MMSSPSSKLSLIRDTVFYSGSNVVVQGISFFLAIFVRRSLGPEAFGVWTLLQVYLTYISYTNFGIFGAIYREIPVLRGRGEESKIESIKNTGFSYVITSSIVVGILMITGTFVFKNRLSEPVFFGLLTLAGLNLLQRANNFQIRILYTDKKFILASKFKIYSALVNAFLCVACVWFYHLYGLYLATLLSFVYNIIYLYSAQSFQWTWQWDRNELKSLMWFGLPLVGLNAATKFLYTFDKLLIGKYLGFKALGTYSIATLASSYLYMIPNMFLIVLFPRTLEKFGEENKTAREKYSLLPSQAICLYFSLAIGISWLAIPYICSIFLPKYVEGIPSLKILMMGALFMTLSDQMSHLLLGYKRHLWTLPVMGVLSLLLWLGSYITLQWGGKMVYIAACSSVGLFILYLFSAYFALRPLYSADRIFQEISKNILPVFLSVLVLVLLDALTMDLSFFTILLKLVFFICFYIMFILCIEKKSPVIHYVRAAYIEWRAAEY